MTAQQAYNDGYNNGYSAGKYTDVGADDKKQAGCECGEKQICRECVTAAAYESEVNARQYSPFEFIAHDMNEDEKRSDMLWERYDRGVAAGIKYALTRKFGRKRKLQLV